jgi:hypothetical protein
MNARQQRKMIDKLQSLRRARLQLAELQVAKAKTALEEAAQRVLDEQRRLDETVAQSQVQYRELTQALQAKASIRDETLYEWQGDRRKVAKGVEDARGRVDAAVQDRQAKDEAVHEARGKQRTATADVERTRMMAEKMSVGGAHD